MCRTPKSFIQHDAWAGWQSAFAGLPSDQQLLMLSYRDFAAVLDGAG